MRSIAFVLFAIALCTAAKQEKVSDSQKYHPYVKNTDGSMIPDKYNTGPDPSLDIPKADISEPGTRCNVSGIQFYRGTKDYYGEYTLLLDFFNFIKWAPPVTTVENFDFSDYEIDFVDYHNTEVERKLIFRNCKFGRFEGGRTRNRNITVEFYDCELTNAHGSFLKFERCVFHSASSDAMVLFTNIEVKDSYIYFTGGDSAGLHMDGFQVYGREEFDVDNIKFNNVRIEIPKRKFFLANESGGEWIAPYVNAPVMVQIEYSPYARNIILENMHINGGGYSIYWHCVKKCLKLSNSVARNIQVGYGHLFGILYYDSSNVDQATNVYENVDHVTSLFVGSAWKDDNGVHMSVSNELLTNRTMACVVDGKDTTTYSIPAHPKLTNKIPVEDLPVIEDFPLDLDIVVGTTKAREVKCYDVTDTGDVATSPLIRSFSLSTIVIPFSIHFYLVSCLLICFLILHI